MATHSSTLAWKIPGTEGPLSYSPWGPKELDTTEQLYFNSLQNENVIMSFIALVV